MTLAEFRQQCRLGAFNDYDGSAYLGTEEEDVGIPVACSQAEDLTSLAKYAHVWWYGK